MLVTQKQIIEDGSKPFTFSCCFILSLVHFVLKVNLHFYNLQTKGSFYYNT